MNARLLLAFAVACGGSALAAQVPTPPPQVFRTETNVVVVDVSVRERGRSVTGLRADDFVLTDNGVRQRIDSVEATSVPIDLTVVVDVSGNPRRPWDTPPSAARTAQHVRSEVVGVAELLRPEDRLRAFAVDTNVQQVLSSQHVGSDLSMASVEGGGLSSLYETLVAALLHPSEPARRHVVVARTKGLDTVSSVTAHAVQAVAERSDVLLHVVMMQTELDNDSAFSGFQCAMMGFCWPTRTAWVPHLRRLMAGRPKYQLYPDGDAVAAGADATGGGLHRAEVFTEPSLRGTFKKAFEDFRSSYVLRYTLQGGAKGGWHDIEVTVPRGKNYTIRARRGYFVETPSPPPPLAPLPARLRSVADFTAAYEGRAYRQVVEDVRRLSDPDDLLRDFEEAGNPWPGHPRREATMMLDLVEPALYASRKETREAGFKTIDRFRRLIQHPLEPDVFERYWYFGLLALLEGMLTPNVADIYVDAALQRFPDEPRFVLSRAIVSDQRWASRDAGALSASGLPSAAHATQIRAEYQAAIAFAETAVEARTRLAYFLNRIGEHNDAMALLTTAGAQPIQEPSLRYLYLLILGRVLWSLDRQDEALSAYRGAQAVFPNAQSPRVALMNALLLRGDRQAAEALAAQIQTDASSDLDPWWMYWQGQYRFHPAVMARLREMSQ